MTTPADEDIAAAYRIGHLAGRTGRDAATCPYNANGTGDQRILARHWVVGYLDGGGKPISGE